MIRRETSRATTARAERTAHAITAPMMASPLSAFKSIPGGGWGAAMPEKQIMLECWGLLLTVDDEEVDGVGTWVFQYDL